MTGKTVQQRRANDVLVYEKRLAHTRARLAALRESSPTARQWAMLTHDGYIVPYVRVGQERHTERAERYKASQVAVAWSLRQSWGDAPAIQGRGIEVTALFVRRSRRGDADNLLKAVKDAANKVVWDDDRFVEFECTAIVRPPGFGVGGDYLEVYVGW